MNKGITRLWAGPPARGLSRASAPRLAGLGAKAAVADLFYARMRNGETEANDMTADSTDAEVAASGGTALRIEVDVTDHEAVTRWSRGRVDPIIGLETGVRPEFVMNRRPEPHNSLLGPRLVVPRLESR
jgi:hypothetical protein